MSLRNRFKTGLAGLALLFGLMTFSVALPAISYAAPAAPSAVSGSKSAACDGIGLTSDNNGCGNGSDNEITTVVRAVVNLLTIVVGIAAVVMIIVSGFRYITSGGETSKVSGAKNALIYSLVGLVIVALAQFIVHFVLTSV